jgi:hypothetical protein
MIPERNSVRPGLRRVIRSLVTALALAVLAVLVLWLLPALLTRHPSGNLSAADKLKAVNDVRTPLVAFLVAMGAAGTLLFTARSYTLNRDGHVTDQYTRAVAQLGDESPSVRVGGVYALERIANDSAKDRVTIIYVLGSFIRERSRVMRERQDEPSEDVRAGLRVVGRILRQSQAVLDLRDADLRHCDLSSIPADQVRLDGAKLDGALLPRAL